MRFDDTHNPNANQPERTKPDKIAKLTDAPLPDEEAEKVSGGQNLHPYPPGPPSQQ